MRILTETAARVADRSDGRYEDGRYSSARVDDDPFMCEALAIARIGRATTSAPRLTAPINQSFSESAAVAVVDVNLETVLTASASPVACGR